MNILYRCGVLGLCFLASCAGLLADSEATPTAYVTTSADGRNLFKMVPPVTELRGDNYVETKPGAGVAYRVLDDGQLEELWRTSGWYSFHVFVGTDGHTLVRMGPWNVGFEPRPEHLGVAFYHDGKFLKSYSTDELIKDRSKVLASASHYQWLANDSRYSGRGDTKNGPSLMDWENRFTLTTIDDWRYEFDTTSGVISKVQTNIRAIGEWASPEDLDRLIISLAVAEYPFPASKFFEYIGLPSKSVEAGFSVAGQEGVNTTLLAITDPANRAGFYAVRRRTKPSSDAGTDSEEDEVISVELVYQAANKVMLVVEADTIRIGWLEQMKAEYKERKETPRKFSEYYLKKINGGRLIPR
jgi:hypothetical protein